MLGVESIIDKIEVRVGERIERKIEPQVKKFYQKNGQWFAVVQFMIGGDIAMMHVALGK